MGFQKNQGEKIPAGGEKRYSLSLAIISCLFCWSVLHHHFVKRHHLVKRIYIIYHVFVGVYGSTGDSNTNNLVKSCVGATVQLIIPAHP
jgi:hypothetical protein